VLAATSYGIVECNDFVSQFLVTRFLIRPVLGIAPFTVQQRCLCCSKGGCMPYLRSVTSSNLDTPFQKITSPTIMKVVTLVMKAAVYLLTFF